MVNIMQLFGAVQQQLEEKRSAFGQDERAFPPRQSTDYTLLPHP